MFKQYCLLAPRQYSIPFLVYAVHTALTMHYLPLVCALALNAHCKKPFHASLHLFLLKYVHCFPGYVVFVWIKPNTMKVRF